MELRNKVWAFTKVSKSIDHLPECGKCNKQNKRNCHHRKIYNWYKYLYIMTGNIYQMTCTDLMDGHISYIQYCEIKMVISILKDARIVTLPDMDIIDSVKSTIATTIKSLPEIIISEETKEILRSHFDITLSEKCYMNPRCSLTRCDTCNKSNIDKRSCKHRWELLNSLFQYKTLRGIMMQNVNDGLKEKYKSEYDNASKQLDIEMEKFPVSNLELEIHYRSSLHLGNKDLSSVYGYTGIPKITEG